MARKYCVGDVVECPQFPYQDDPSKHSRRPGLILKVEMSNQQLYFWVAKITTSDNSHYITGKFVSAKSKEGKQMRLTSDSFVHLENVARIPLFGIKRLIGVCPIMEKIRSLCKNGNIPEKYWAE